MREVMQAGCLCLMAACGRSATAPEPFAMQDSSGVTIVENRGDTAAAPIWTLKETVRIGGRPDSAPYDLNQIFRAVRLSDGRVLIGDNATMELRFFDSTGQHLRTTGRQGGGPGEFQFVGHFWTLSADTVEIMDTQQRRLTRLTPSGDVLWSRRVEVLRGEEIYVSPIGRKNADTLLGLYHDSQGGEINRAVGERFRTSLNVVTMAAEGPLDTLVTLPDAEFFVILWNEGGGRDLKAFDAVPFSASTTVRAEDGRIHAGHGSRFQVDTYTLGGTLERSVRITMEPRPVTAEDQEAWRQEDLRSLDRWRGAPPRAKELMRRMVSEAPFAQTLPAFETFDVGDDGATWIELFRRPGDLVRRYLALDRRGVLAARVTLPPRTRPTDFGARHVVAVQRDEDDVEYVILYRIRKPDPQETSQ